MYRYYILLLFLVFVTILRGQDIHFSQFYHVEAWQTPAELGLFNGQHRTTAIYRSQWQSVPVPYLSFGASCEGQLLPLRLLGLGHAVNIRFAAATNRNAWPDLARQHGPQKV